MTDNNYIALRDCIDSADLYNLFIELLKLIHLRAEFFANLVLYGNLKNQHAISDSYLSIISTTIDPVLEYLQSEPLSIDQLVFIIDFFAAEFRGYCLIIQRFSTTNVNRTIIPNALLDKTLNLVMMILDNQDEDDNIWALINRFDFAESINIFHFMYSHCNDKDIVLEIMDILAKQVKYNQLNLSPQDIAEHIKKVNAYCLEIILKEENLILLAGAVNLIIEVYAYDNYDDLFNSLKLNVILQVS